MRVGGEGRSWRSWPHLVERKKRRDMSASKAVNLES
jgi:hypothetical protein